MNIIEAIAERRIAAARDAGLFDGLAGAGRPIDDLDRPRPPGWWAARLVRQERSIARADGIDSPLPTAFPPDDRG